MLYLNYFCSDSSRVWSRAFRTSLQIFELPPGVGIGGGNLFSTEVWLCKLGWIPLILSLYCVFCWTAICYFSLKQQYIYWKFCSRVFSDSEKYTSFYGIFLLELETQITRGSTYIVQFTQVNNLLFAERVSWLSWTGNKDVHVWGIGQIRECHASSPSSASWFTQ